MFTTEQEKAASAELFDAITDQFSKTELFIVKLLVGVEDVDKAKELLYAVIDAHHNVLHGLGFADKYEETRSIYKDVIWKMAVRFREMFAEFNNGGAMTLTVLDDIEELRKLAEQKMATATPMQGEK